MPQATTFAWLSRVTVSLAEPSLCVRSHFLKWLPPTYRSEMSSKRGRKRNDNLPPNRARDVQRAFRARRAAHLQSLEQRVSELEEENGYLRQALGLPPSNRPLLGKGPTGKDKPRLDDMTVSSASSVIGMHESGRESSNGGSPSSRTSSLSPSTLTLPMPVRSAPALGSGSWDDTILSNDQHSDLSVSPSSAYPLAMSAPPPVKPLHHYASYASGSLPTPSRGSVASLYLATTSQYPSDRVSNSVYNGHSYLVRGETSRQYSHSTFQSTDIEIHPHTAPPAIPIPHSEPGESPMLYPHRRSLAESPSYTVYPDLPHTSPLQQHVHPDLPHTSPLQQHVRGPEYPRPQDSNGHLPLHLLSQQQAQPQHSRSMFGPDGI
ncbi:hypothetical protein AX14_002909 [Amanita brunnescens Koide BX004]|nr:hypothetical protein AX14_002909 [Amanita brunnescens Koide BX004]